MTKKNCITEIVNNLKLVVIQWRAPNNIEFLWEIIFQRQSKAIRLFWWILKSNFSNFSNLHNRWLRQFFFRFHPVEHSNQYLLKLKCWPKAIGFSKSVRNDTLTMVNLYFIKLTQRLRFAKAYCISLWIHVQSDLVIQLGITINNKNNQS